MQNDFLDSNCFTKIQLTWMQLALAEAKKGLGFVHPNPWVGAVLVKKNRLIAKSAHLKFGEAHAEANALTVAGKRAKGCDLYVTLEPCSHYGKKSPCVEAIIAAGIKRVFIAMKDPNPLVCGKGIARLQEAKIKVLCGLCFQEALMLNQPFIKGIIFQKSYLFLKSALTLDGKIACFSGDSKWITNAAALNAVDHHRQKSSAILCGERTLRCDNPSLTIRSLLPSKSTSSPAVAPYQPHRLFLLQQLEGIDDSFHAVSHASDGKTLFFLPEPYRGSDLVSILEKKGVRFEYYQGEKLSFDELLRRTYQLGFSLILLEGGGRLYSQAFEENEVDGGEIFIAPKLLGDSQATPFLSGFHVTSINDAISLQRVKPMIYEDNIAFQFYQKIYGEKECLPD